MEERTLVICPPGEIDGQVAKEFLESLAILDTEDGPIKVLICSDGGIWSCGLAIYEAIRSSRNHITTHGMGSVGSIAVLVLQAGDKRLLSENSTLFLHETSAHFEGSMTQIRALADETQRLHDKYCELLSKRSKADTKQIDQFCRAETTLLASEALSCGLVDGVVVDTSKPAKKVKKGKKK